MNMQCTIKDFVMSFDFSNINPINKAQASYKDGSGMGGGGMYFRQGKKRKDEPDEDMFERSEDKNENDIDFEQELKEEDIPKDNLVNKFINWFRIGKDAEEEVPCYAVNKKTFHLSGSKELLNAETQAEVQLWKYDPSILAKNGFVDSLSLALSFQKPADTFLKKD